MSSTPVKLQPLASPLSGTSPVSFPMKPSLSSQKRAKLMHRTGSIGAGINSSSSQSFLASLTDSNAAAASAIEAADRLLKKSSKKARKPLQSLKSQNRLTTKEAASTKEQQVSALASVRERSLSAASNGGHVRRRSLSAQKLKPMTRNNKQSAPKSNALKIYEQSPPESRLVVSPPSSPSSPSSSSSSSFPVSLHPRLSASSRPDDVIPSASESQPCSNTPVKSSEDSGALVESSERSHESLLILRRNLKAWRGATDDAILGSPFAKFVKACAKEPLTQNVQEAQPVIEPAPAFAEVKFSSSTVTSSNFRGQVLSSPSREFSFPQGSQPAGTTPPPSYASSHKKRRVSSTKKCPTSNIPPAPAVVNASLPADPPNGAENLPLRGESSSGASAASDVAIFLANLFPEELSMTASAINNRESENENVAETTSKPRPVAGTQHPKQNNRTLFRKKQPSSLSIPATNNADPSPVKKRRVVDAGFDEDADVLDFARQLRGGVHEAQTVAVPTPTFSDSKTSETIFGSMQTSKHIDPKSVAPKRMPKSDSRTAASKTKMAQPSSQHTLAPVPPLSETDIRYGTALLGFENAMKEGPSTRSTDLALQCLIELLNGSEILGDPKIGIDEVSRRVGEAEAASQTKEEKKKKRDEEAALELTLKAMAQMNHEQSKFNKRHSSSILRWKISYGMKKRSKEKEDNACIESRDDTNGGPAEQAVDAVASQQAHEA